MIFSDHSHPRKTNFHKDRRCKLYLFQKIELRGHVVDVRSYLCPVLQSQGPDGRDSRLGTVLLTNWRRQYWLRGGISW